jgi:hypothetical protein
MEERVLYRVKSYRCVTTKLELVKQMYGKNTLKLFAFKFGKYLAHVKYLQRKSNTVQRYL